MKVPEGILDLFVPGRICLFGEHSDWAGAYRTANPTLEKGYTLICGTQQGIYARISPHPDSLLLSAATPDGGVRGPELIPIEPAALLAVARQGGFWSYVAGVAYQVLKRYPIGGLSIDNYRTDLPVKKGLSSSAAICVLTARAFNQLYELGLSVRDEMELAYQGEITTPSRCGRMDQGCAFGSHPVLMTFDGDRLETTELSPATPLHYVIVDLQAHKDTVEILRSLNACYPYAQDEACSHLHDLLGPTNRRIVSAAVDALQAGNAPRLGTLMNEAQTLFDRFAAPLCPQELSASALHRLLAYPPLAPHIYGGKGVGSQGDGSAQLLARSPEDQQAVIALLQRELGLPALPLTIKPGSTNLHE